MKTAIAIVSLTLTLSIVSLILALSIVSISDADTCDSSDCTPASILIEENDIGRLYKIEMKDRPLYYYEIDTENGTIYKIVAMATMHLNVSVA